MDDTGRILISASDLAEGKRVLVSLGVKIIWEFANFPAIYAKVSPELAVQLRRLPNVDYIEPDWPGSWTN